MKLKTLLIALAVVAFLVYGIYTMNATGSSNCGSSTCLNLHDQNGVAVPQ